MNYTRPELGERLAADYVLGMMPARARHRFERAIAADATLAAAVAAWSDRLAPLDTVTAEEAPPARVWRAVDHRVGPGMRHASPARGFGLFWRGFATAAFAACAAIVIYVAVSPTGTIEKLAEKTGMSGLMELAKNAPADIGLSTMRLGVPERERPRWLRAALLLSDDAVPLTAPPQSR